MYSQLRDMSSTVKLSEKSVNDTNNPADHDGAFGADATEFVITFFSEKVYYCFDTVENVTKCVEIGGLRGYTA
jgi:hypothetical protein